VLAASNHHAPTQRNSNSYEISLHSRVCHPTQLGAILTLSLAATRLLSSTRPRCQKTKAPTNCPVPATPYHTRLVDAWHVLFPEVVVRPNKGLSNENTASFKPWGGESTRQKAIVPFGKFQISNGVLNAPPLAACPCQSPVPRRLCFFLEQVTTPLLQSLCAYFPYTLVWNGGWCTGKRILWCLFCMSAAPWGKSPIARTSLPSSSPS